MDHTANHYFALATIMNLGSNGISDKLTLGEPLPTVPKMRDYHLLPSRWEDVEEYVNKDDAGEYLKKAVDPELLEIIMKMRKYDVEHYFKLPLSDEVKELTIRY